MKMDKKKLIPAIAIIILLIGSFSSIYVFATQTNESNITINEQKYSIDQIFFIAEPRSFNALNFSGVALDDLILKVGVGFTNNREYTIVGSDGYQKTVNWENMENGLLTYEKMVVFSDLPKSFRVKDVVNIEVR
jgi:hypothetical protein